MRILSLAKDYNVFVIFGLAQRTTRRRGTRSTLFSTSQAFRHLSTKEEGCRRTPMLGAEQRATLFDTGCCPRGRWAIG